MSELWKARLLPGSFNGIPFKIESHELSGGRHSKQHEPPDRNSGFSEDIGKKTPGFRIEGYVLGDNYFFIRDALINLLENKTEGILVHPYLGIKTVQPMGYTMRESTVDGRIAFFSMEFAKKGNPFFPFAIIDAIVDFATAIVGAVAAVQSAFEFAYSVQGLPAFTLESAELMVNEFSATVDQGFNNVRLSDEEYSASKKQLQDLDADTPDLVRGDPNEMASRIDEIIAGLKDLVPDAPESSTIDSSSGRDDQLAVFRPLLEFRGVADDIPATTPTRIQESANANAIADLIQQLTICRLGEKIVDKSFKTNSDAEAARGLVTDAIEVQLNRERIDDESFQNLEDVNAKIVAAVPNTKSDLANVQTIELAVSTPSIVLAYDLYQGVSADTIVENEKDIIDRNRVRNPGFINGETEVLTGTGG